MHPLRCLQRPLPRRGVRAPRLPVAIDGDEHLVESDADRGLGRFSHHDLRVWKGRAYRQFYLRPRYVARELRQFLMRTDARILRAGLSMLNINILLYRTTASGSVWHTAAPDAAPEF